MIILMNTAKVCYYPKQLHIVDYHHSFPQHQLSLFEVVASYIDQSGATNRHHQFPILNFWN